MVLLASTSSVLRRFVTVIGIFRITIKPYETGGQKNNEN